MPRRRGTRYRTIRTLCTRSYKYNKGAGRFSFVPCIIPSTMTRQGGFPVSIFCNQPKSEPFLCCVCKKVCRSPVTCQSNVADHLFCLECLRQYASCPVCREPLTAPVTSAFALAQVSALDVKCEHDKCQWKGTCGRFDGHLDTDCLHQPIKCSAEGCGALVPRGEMVIHTNSLFVSRAVRTPSLMPTETNRIHVMSV